MASILKVFLEDHKVLDTMLESFIEAQISHQSTVMDQFNDLKNSLAVHMQAEEGLCNSFSHKNSALDEIIKIMREQHKQINEYFEDLGSFEGNKEEYSHLVFALVNLVKSHERFEENQLYPKFDMLLTEQEKEEVIYNLQLKSKVTN